MTATNLKYHRDAVALLPKPPALSVKAAERLAQRERELGIAIPESVREWYSHERAVDMLRQHSNADEPVTTDKLGEPFPNWYGGGPRDFAAQGLVVFMHENQGVCNWAFRLDGNPDPEVVVEVDTAPTTTGYTVRISSVRLSTVRFGIIGMHGTWKVAGSALRPTSLNWPKRIFSSLRPVSSNAPQPTVGQERRTTVSRDRRAAS